MFPLQKGALDAQRTASLASIEADEVLEGGQSVARGLEWGQRVGRNPSVARP